MAVLEFLSAAAGTWVVAARQFLHADGLAGLALCSLTGVVAGGCLLPLVNHLVALALLVTLGVLLWCGFLHVLLLSQLWYLPAHEDFASAVVHVINHIIE